MSFCEFNLFPVCCSIGDVLFRFSYFLFSDVVCVFFIIYSRRYCTTIIKRFRVA